MPGRARRREMDLRSTRFESEFRVSELQRLRSAPEGMKDSHGTAKRVYTCSNCQHIFEERSRVCPRCDTRTMGEIRPIPERLREEALRKSVERLRAKHA